MCTLAPFSGTQQDVWSGCIPQMHHLHLLSAQGGNRETLAISCTEDAI